MICPDCKIQMQILWNEILGFMAKCECCLMEIELRYDRRSVIRNEIDKGEKHAA